MEAQIIPIQVARTPTTHHHSFNDCPGAWYGFMPGAGKQYGIMDNTQGHIVVDPAQIVEALDFLRRRYLIGKASLTTDGGIFINLAKF